MSRGNIKLRSTAVFGVLLLLTACQGQTDDGLAVTTPPAATAATEATTIDAQTSSATSAPNFPASQYVEASVAGLVGDGTTDNTAAFQSLLAAGNRTIHVPAGDYLTGRLEIPGNTVLRLDPGVIIRDSGHLGVEDRLINIERDNVYIGGLGARVISNRSDYTSGEQRHGIFIFGASNIVIDGVESTGHGGDGFYVGGPLGRPSQDVVLKGCLASNNRRQGLSITSAARVLVVDCQFDHTNGTAPQFGIDLEPDRPSDLLSQIRILRPYTLANAGGGIAIYLQNLDGSSPPVDIQIIEHLSRDESPALDARGSPAAPVSIQYSPMPQTAQESLSMPLGLPN
jgi:hypothetical protein